MSIPELIANWERRYVENLNALRASIYADDDYWRWNGHAAQLRSCLTELQESQGLPVPAYTSKEWRRDNGVTNS